MLGTLVTHLDDLLALTGALALVRGMALWHPAAGWMAAGVLLLVASSVVVRALRPPAAGA